MVLGIRQPGVQRYITRFESLFTVLFETENVYREWKRLVVTHSITGMEAHDTRLVAAMFAHGIENIVTSNTADFVRYSGINVVHPTAV
jgi:hypothetical protein